MIRTYAVLTHGIKKVIHTFGGIITFSLPHVGNCIWVDHGRTLRETVYDHMLRATDGLTQWWVGFGKTA